MVLIRNRKTNTNEVTTISSVIFLNTSTTTTIIVSNIERVYVAISNDGPGTFYLKLQAASVDDVQKGILVESGDTYELPTDNIYTGEISGIGKTGSPDVFVTEY